MASFGSENVTTYLGARYSMFRHLPRFRHLSWGITMAKLMLFLPHLISFSNNGYCPQVSAPKRTWPSPWLSLH